MIRDQIRDLLSESVTDNSVDHILNKLDPIILSLIGDDDTAHTEMPEKWNESLRKQYVNFRNHLRRSQRNSYGKTSQ